jgi:hypothetical protein
MTTLNIEKRIKRHVIGSRLDFFAATLPGCESYCRQTLTGLSPSIKVAGTVRGGVLFDGRLTDLYLANLHLRTAGRVLLRLASFRATAFRQLEKKGVRHCLVSLPAKWSASAPGRHSPSLTPAPLRRHRRTHRPLHWRPLGGHGNCTRP